MAGGIFSMVNGALPTGQRNNLIPGLHRIRIEEVKVKAGTAKNTGKEFFIINGTVVATNVTGNPNLAVGSTVSIAFNTKAYPESAASDIKSFLLTQFSEEDLNSVDRNLLQSNEIQKDGNPFLGKTHGITWAEALQLVTREESMFKGFLMDVESVNKPTKAGQPYTKHYYKRAGEITSLGPVS